MPTKPTNLSRRSFLGLQSLMALATLSACAGSEDIDDDELGTPTAMRTLDDMFATWTANIGICSDNEPFGYINSKGQYSGFDQYFCQYFYAKKTGLVPQYVAVDPINRYDKLLTHEVDFCIAQMSSRDERADEVEFTNPLYTLQLGLVSPVSAVVESVDQLAQGELIVCEGSYAQHFAQDTWPEVTLRAYDTMTDAFGSLRAGTGIALLTDEVTASCWASKQADFVLGMRGIDEPREIAIAVAPGNVELLEKLNETIYGFIANYYASTAYDTYVRPVVDADYGWMLIDRNSI